MIGLRTIRYPDTKLSEQIPRTERGAKTETIHICAILRANSPLPPPVRLRYNPPSAASVAVSGLHP